MTRLHAVLLAGCCLAQPPLHAASPAGADRPHPAALAAAPGHELPAATVRGALERADWTQRPRRFAVPVAVGLGLAAGRWQTLDAGVASWQLRLRSPGALSLSAHLTPIALPHGAELWVRGAGGEAYGPYTAADLTPSGFWTPFVAADELALELRAPVAVAAGARLEVARAFHGTAVPGKEIPGKAGPGSSGSCNVNAACESGTWGREARAGAMITIDNQFFCSGQLLNNVKQDRAPLFLTARHCGVGRESGPAASVNFFFGYAAPCNGPAPPQPVPVTGGAVLLADEPASDVALLRMNGSPPADAVFAGWDATGAGASSGACLHHPSGDAQKISLFTTPLTRAGVDIGGPCQVQAWQVSWARGTTEGGSSGGGLWNASQRLIGVLSGGLASCSDPGGVDYFGRFDLAWTASPQADGQLKAHLDPDGTCIASVPGLDPLANPNPGPVTSGPQRCVGETARCSSGIGAGGGGGIPASLSALLLAALLRRRRYRTRGPAG